jgi:hypothetical protein
VLLAQRKRLGKQRVGLIPAAPRSRPRRPASWQLLRCWPDHPFPGHSRQRGEVPGGSPLGNQRRTTRCRPPHRHTPLVIGQHHGITLRTRHRHSLASNYELITQDTSWSFSSAADCAWVPEVTSDPRSVGSARAWQWRAPAPGSGRRRQPPAASSRIGPPAG